MRKTKEAARCSISQLGGWTWTQPVPDEVDSSVIKRFYALRNTPIGTLSPADLRFLIGQHECLEFLVPMALGLLANDPWLEAEYYPGDLLISLLRIEHPPRYWSKGNKDLSRFSSIAKAAIRSVPNGTSRKDIRLLESVASSFE
ncbi:MAG: hypothetical protein JNN32_05165 [Flavobacteriales bacterium]|nr:hypothetical protein [Flavobacteriales bacterium]